MPLMLTRDSIMSRMGGYRTGARGLLRSADAYARKDLRVARTAEVSLSAFTFGVLQGRWKDKGGLTAFALPVDLLAGATFHIIGLFPFARHTPTICTTWETAHLRRSSQRQATGSASAGARAEA